MYLNVSESSATRNDKQMMDENNTTPDHKQIVFDD